MVVRLITMLVRVHASKTIHEGGLSPQTFADKPYALWTFIFKQLGINPFRLKRKVLKMFRTGFWASNYSGPYLLEFRI